MTQARINAQPGHLPGLSRLKEETLKFATLLRLHELASVQRNWQEQAKYPQKNAFGFFFLRTLNNNWESMDHFTIIAISQQYNYILLFYQLWANNGD